MVALLTTPDRMSGRFHVESESRLMEVQLAIEAASEAIWREIGAPQGQDFAYAVGVTERYKGHNSPSLRLRRRPVTSITSISYRDDRNNLLRTLSTDEYTLVEPEKGHVISSVFPDTRAIGYTPFEQIRMGIALPLLEVVYTGGWVTAAQAEADTSLTRNAPTDLELACQTQVVHWVSNWSRNEIVRTETTPGAITSYREIDSDLLPTVKAACRRYRRRENFGGT